MRGLSGSLALVTGGSRGIGLALAQRLTECGCTVVISSRQADACAAAVESLEPSLHAPSHSFIPYNVASSSPCDLFAQIHDRYGRHPNLLAAAAGITLSSILQSTTAEEINEVLHTNLVGSIAVTQEFVRQAIRLKLPLELPKAAVLFGSIVGRDGNVGQSIYAASKSGLDGFVRSVARETGRFGVRINLIAPGFIETDMTASVPEARRKELLDRIPLRRFGRAHEVASLAAFLLSAEASYITGRTADIDGGLAL